MHISKLHAARSQLESAIRLFFVNGDPIATHTLTGAARTLLVDLARPQQEVIGLNALLEQSIRAEHLDEIKRALVKAQNFFKHADRDPDEVFDYKPGATEILLWDACVLYEELTTHKHPVFLVYRIWFSLSHPQLLLPEVQEKIPELAQTFDPRDRSRFLAELLPFAEEWSAGGG